MHKSNRIKFFLPTMIGWTERKTNFSNGERCFKVRLNAYFLDFLCCRNVWILNDMQMLTGASFFVRLIEGKTLKKYQISLIFLKFRLICVTKKKDRSTKVKLHSNKMNDKSNSCCFVVGVSAKTYPLPR